MLGIQGMQAGSGSTPGTDLRAAFQTNLKQEMPGPRLAEDLALDHLLFDICSKFCRNPSEPLLLSAFHTGGCISSRLCAKEETHLLCRRIRFRLGKSTCMSKVSIGRAVHQGSLLGMGLCLCLLAYQVSRLGQFFKHRAVWRKTRPSSMTQNRCHN